MIMGFLEHIQKAAEEFKKKVHTVVRIIYNADCDGIAAASIMIMALRRQETKFVASAVKGIDDKLLDELKQENYSTYMFLDIGSSTVKKIDDFLKGKMIYIMDHHMPEKEKTNLNHFNPFLFELDGTSDISAAGIVYFFAKYIDEANSSLAYLAFIGAIGDNHEKGGMNGLNKTILDEAEISGLLEARHGVRMFGINTKPLHKVLEYSTNPYMPGISGNEQGAIVFLKELGIEAKKKDDSWISLHDLDEAKMKELVTAIILRRLGSDEEVSIFGQVYILPNEDEKSPTRDAVEFSSLLNCCCRMHQYSIGIGTCLGSKPALQKATELMTRYRKEIISALEWFYNNRSDAKKVIEGKGYVILNLEDSIRDSILGTLISTVSQSNLYHNGTIILGMEHTLGDETRISSRISGFVAEGIELDMILVEMIKKLGAGSSGGHRMAAGAVIPQDKEEKFLEISNQILAKRALEESIA